MLSEYAKTSKDSQTIKYADIIDNCTEIVKYDRVLPASSCPNATGYCEALMETKAFMSGGDDIGCSDG